ncbi:hypothetical protein C922_02264 [Plasmodium inui San Antonio 1]|uniref:Partial AB-hydrolase lipase domain-containing protein n=1 Tax=Plasmodium inui San Antonio 1 TaxID=1237626 RepID=W7ADJ0_9APIC|nr:hypothetical protein C922_02264 [Plasmodium inui San Antonio 1]EUD67114.1 hypothetical protein C922_02264 [Plasmodium inui San Antonio 1]
MSVGLGPMLASWRELKLNPMPGHLAYRNANVNNNNNVDGDKAQRGNSSNSSPRSNTCSAANRSNNKNDVKDEEHSRECTPYKIEKRKKKNNNLDSMQQVLLKLTNGKLTSEQHHVYTVDGYRLNLYRIVSTNEKEKLRKKKEVFCLNHGLLESSISYICRGYNSLALQLFANDYDVWISNNRGNAFTKFVGKNYALKKLRERYSLQDLKDIGLDVSEEIATHGSSNGTGDNGKDYTANEGSRDEETLPKARRILNLHQGGNTHDNAAESHVKKNWQGAKRSDDEHKSKTIATACGSLGPILSIVDDPPAEGSRFRKKTLSDGNDKPQGRTECSSSSNSHKDSKNISCNIDNATLVDILKGTGGSEGAYRNENSTTMSRGKKGQQQDDHDEDDDDLIEVKEPEIVDWTFEDMGTKDIPAIIKYIRKKTQKEKIVYVGFSQGSVQLLVSCCLNDYVNDSIKRTYLISLPVIAKNYDELSKAMKHFYIMASNWLEAIFGTKNFLSMVFPEKISVSLIGILGDLYTGKFLKFYTGNVDHNYKKIYYKHTPSGSTSKANLKKWLSSVDNRPVSEAIDKYAGKCCFPITVVYGMKDCAVDAERSIEYMKKKFTKNDLKIITEPEWSHLDCFLTDKRNIALSCILEDMKWEEEKEKKQKEKKQEEKKREES